MWVKLSFITFCAARHFPCQVRNLELWYVSYRLSKKMPLSSRELGCYLEKMENEFIFPPLHRVHKMLRQSTEYFLSGSNTRFVVLTFTIPTNK